MKRVSRVMELKPQCSKCLELRKVEAVHQIGTVSLVPLTIHLQEEVINTRENNHLCEDCGVQWAKVQWEVQLPDVSPVQELVNKIICFRVFPIFLTL